MKARIWKDRESGRWRYSLPGCCAPFDASGSRLTWKKALLAVQEHISSHRFLDDALDRAALGPPYWHGASP